MKQPANDFAQFPRHDHQECVRKALNRAEEICREKQIKLTPLRRQVLQLIWRSHQPVGAYQLLEQLNGDGQAKPPTIYRTLEFLQQAGLVHRLATLNAYIGCPSPDDGAHGPFLICNLCQRLVELRTASVTEALRSSAAELGFTITDQALELHGLCPECREQP